MILAGIRISLCLVLQFVKENKMAFDLNNEIGSHLKYYNQLMEESTKIGDDMESIVKGIMKDTDNGEELDRGVFVELEEKAFTSSIIQTEIVKAVARIRLLYQMSFGMGVKLSLTPLYQNILDSIVGADTVDFVFMENNGRLVFKDEEFGKFIHANCEKRVPNESLTDRYRMLRAQYDEYMNGTTKVSDNGKKTHTE